MSTSPHKNWKGCPLCDGQKHRGQGRSKRDPLPVVRFMGKRNYGRHEVPE